MNDRLLTLLQLHAVAAFLGFGLVMSWGQIVYELSLHTLVPHRAIAYSGIWMALGGALGVIVPPVLLRRRMRTPEAASTAAGPIARRFQIDATGGALVGVLSLPTALAWGAVVGCGASLEFMRHWLVAHSTLPAAAILALLWTPACLLSLAAGAASVVTIAALHGWKRELGLNRPRQSVIWPTLLVCGAAAGWIRDAQVGGEILWLLGPLALFGCAIVASARHTTSLPAAEPPPRMRPPVGGSAIPIVGALLAGANAAAVLIVTIDSRQESLRFGITLSAALLGAAAAFTAPIATLRSWPTAPISLLLISIVGWCIPVFAPAALAGETTLIRTGFVMLVSIVAFLVCLRQLAVRIGSTRRGLAFCLVTCCGGASIGWALSMSSGPAPGRVVDVEQFRSSSLLDGLLRNAPGLRYMTALTGGAELPDAPVGSSWNSGWRAALAFDVADEKPDLIFLSGDCTNGIRSESAAERVARRVFGALRPGGRIVVELPTPPIDTAILSAWKWSKLAPGARALYVTGVDGWEALVIGGDVPGLIDTVFPRDMARPTIEVVTGAKQLAELRRQHADGRQPAQP